MKKTFVFLIFIAAYVLITRFIYFDNSAPPMEQEIFRCSGTSEQKLFKGHVLYPCATLNALKPTYVNEIKPILQNKCFMCHGVAKTLPLYAKIPPTSWFLEHNQYEAKEHINMSFGFPFRSQKPLGEQMVDLKEVVQNGSMPPWYYKIMHWKSGLTPPEKEKILNWIEASQKALQP